jgi:hypothetical protein
MKQTTCIACLLLIGLCLLNVGCENSGAVPVEGTVQYQGTPVEGISLTFSPQDDSRPSSGSTDESGHFTLMHTIDDMGALPGKHNVTFEWEAASEGEKPSAEISAILAKHGDGGTPYEVEITGGVTDLVINIE